MNTYAVSIQWDNRTTLSVVEADTAEHALGTAIAGQVHVRLPIRDYAVKNINLPEDTLVTPRP